MANEPHRAEVHKYLGVSPQAVQPALAGNNDASDLKPPQLKLLAGQSPEVLDGVPWRCSRQFLDHPFSTSTCTWSVVGSPILLRKSYQVWATGKRQDQTRRDRLRSFRTASTGTSRINRLTLSSLGNPRTYVWKLGRTVTETGAHKFGSKPGRRDKSSKLLSPRSLTIFCGASICPMGRSSCACLKRRALSASSLLRISLGL